MGGLAGTAAKLLASLDLDTRPFEAGARRAGVAIGRMEQRFGKLGALAQRGARNFATNVANIGVAAAGAAATGIAFSIRAASDLDESLAKSRVVFGSFAGEMEAWAATGAQAFGQSKQQALEAAGTYGNLLQAFGANQEASAGMSKSLVQLAADLASFNNTSVDDALIALRSGLSGETEPLKRYGIAINDARMRTVLAEQGFKDLKGTLTPLQKATAAYAIIMQDSALAQGDFERTSGGLANQQRILRANLDNTAATIGRALLPKVTELAVKFNKLITDNQGTIQRLAGELPAVFDSIVGIASNIPWGTIGEAFTLMGQGAKIALQMFSSMPPWVQTAVLTGWGLNKLTGGALGGIVGELGKGLIKGVLGMNAGVVNIKAGVVNGAGGVGGAAGRGGVGGLVAGGMTIGGLLLILDGLSRLPTAVQSAADAFTSAQRGDAAGFREAFRANLANAAPWIGGSIAAPLLGPLQKLVTNTDRMSRPRTEPLRAPSWQGPGTTRELRGFGLVEKQRDKVDWSEFTKKQSDTNARLDEQAQKLEQQRTAVERVKASVDWGAMRTTAATATAAQTVSSAIANQNLRATVPINVYVDGVRQRSYQGATWLQRSTSGGNIRGGAD